MKTISTQRDLLIALADPSLRLSIWDGKARIITRNKATERARVKNGLAGRMVERGLMVYDGVYELTDKGKETSARTLSLLKTRTPRMNFSKRGVIGEAN